VVMWEAREKDQPQTHRYGLRWVALTSEYRGELRRLLST
jgi:hypothetical protein